MKLSHFGLTAVLLFTTLAPFTPSAAAQQPSPAPAPAPVADEALPPGMERYAKDVALEGVMDPRLRAPNRGRNEGSRATDIRQLFENYGVRFPPGASISYNGSSSKLIVVNTPENLKMLKYLLSEVLTYKLTQLELSVALIRLSPQTAADWGLDGLPAVHPETSPFKGPVPRMMTAEQSATFFAAVRQTEGFRLVAHNEMITISGQTTTSANSEDVRLAEGYYESSFETVPPKTEGGPATTVRDDASGSSPIYGDSQPLGMRSVITPTVGDDGNLVDLECRLQYTDLAGWQEEKIAISADHDVTQRMPVIRTKNAETRLLMVSGNSALIGVGHRDVPGVEQVAEGRRVTTPTDTGSYFFVLTASIQPVDNARKTQEMIPLP